MSGVQAVSAEAIQYLQSLQVAPGTQRKDGLGGTDLAGICGQDESWNSPFAVWGRKTGVLDENESNEAADWGLRAEPMIAAEFARRHSVVVVSPGWLQDQNEKRFLGTPDSVLADLTEGYDWKFPTDYGSMQFKPRDEFDERPDDSHLIPAKMMIQLHWYAPLLGIWQWRLVVLPMTHRMEEYRVDISKDLCEALRYRGLKFWHDHVEKEDPPDPTASKRDAEALLKMFPKEDTSDLIDPDDRQLVTLEGYEAALVDYWTAEKKVDGLKHLLQLMIGKKAAGFLLPDGKKVTWKTAKSSKGINWEAVAKFLADGDIPAKVLKKHMCVTKSGGRRFVSPRRWKSDWAKEEVLGDE